MKDLAGGVCSTLYQSCDCGTEGEAIVRQTLARNRTQQPTMAEGEVTGEAALDDLPRGEGGGASEKDSNNTAASAADTSAVDGAAVNSNSLPSTGEIEALRESPTDQLEGLLGEDYGEKSAAHETAKQDEGDGRRTADGNAGHANGINGDSEIDTEQSAIERSPDEGANARGDSHQRKKQNGIDGAISEIKETAPTPGNSKPIATPGRSKNREEMVLASVHAAARYGNIEALRNLVAKSGPNEKDSVGFTPSHFAACYGHTEALTFLIGNGSDIEVTSEHGWTPLHVAARNGHIDCVTVLLEAGVDVNKPDQKNWTALHNASCSPSAECVEKLLKWGAEKDKQAVWRKDDDGWTPLHFAARFNNVEALQKLLEEKADPNIKDVDGWTAMHNSARNGRNRCVQVLIEHKADLFQVTRYKETPLHVACRKGKAKVVEKIVLGAEQQGLLQRLLAMADLDGKKAEHVASSPFIRRTLNKEFAAGGSTYELPGERLRKGMSVANLNTGGTAKKSAACTIV